MAVGCIQPSWRGLIRKGLERDVLLNDPPGSGAGEGTIRWLPPTDSCSHLKVHLLLDVASWGGFRRPGIHPGSRLPLAVYRAGNRPAGWRDPGADSCRGYVIPSGSSLGETWSRPLAGGGSQGKDVPGLIYGPDGHRPLYPRPEEQWKKDGWYIVIFVISTDTWKTFTQWLYTANHLYSTHTDCGCCIKWLLRKCTYHKIHLT